MFRVAPAVVVCLLLAVAEPAGARADGLYVALGDSYTAGPLVQYQHGVPIDCARSTMNYPALTAQALRLTLRDVSCSSATTEHMEHPQTGLPLGGTNPPQFDGVTPDAQLVTVGIGGNDAGLVGVGERCGVLGATDPNGHACRTYYTQGGRDQVAERIDAAAPKVAAVLEGIHRRAPGARVAIVGYPAVAPTDGTACYPLVPVSADDLAYVSELLIRINAMIAQQAAAHRAEYVDTFAPSVGHDVCELPPNRWFEGVVPTMPAYPLHPNALGEASMARSTIAVLSNPRPVGPVPHLAGLRVHRAPRRTGPPARIGFRLDRAATVTFTLRRRTAPRHYGPVVGTVVRAARLGRGRVSLSRKLLGRRPGAYLLTATPVADGVSGTAVGLRVRVP